MDDGGSHTPRLSGNWLAYIRTILRNARVFPCDLTVWLVPHNDLVKVGRTGERVGNGPCEVEEFGVQLVPFLSDTTT